MTHILLLYDLIYVVHASIKYDFSVPVSFINEHVIVAIHNVGQNPEKGNNIS